MGAQRSSGRRTGGHPAQGGRRVRLAEVPPAERGNVIAEYLRAGRLRSGAEANAKQARYYFGLEPEASLHDIEAIVDYYPVFRIAYEGK